MFYVFINIILKLVFHYFYMSMVDFLAIDLVNSSYYFFTCEFHENQAQH